MVNRCILSAITSPHSPYPNSYTVSPPPNAGLRYVPELSKSAIVRGDFQDTVIGTGGEAETLHGGFEDGEAGKRRERRTDGVAWVHLGITIKYPHKRQNAFPGSHGLL